MIVLLLAAALTAPPQAAPQTQPARAAGLATPWEVKKMVEDAQAPVNRLGTALGHLQVQAWQGPGASNYVAQADSARRQVLAINDNLSAMAHTPEKLSVVLRAYLSLQHVEGMLDSLADGAARFQSPAASHEIQDATNALLDQREKFVQYLLDLSEYTENTAASAQSELESCRQQLWKRPSKK